MRNFLWTGNIFQKKLISVVWTKTCFPKNEGGSGIRSLQAVNAGFSTKMAWWIMTQNSLATNFFHGKYLRQIDKPRLIGAFYFFSLVSSTSSLYNFIGGDYLDNGYRFQRQILD